MSFFIYDFFQQDIESDWYKCLCSHLDHVMKIQEHKGDNCKLPDHGSADQVSIYFYFLRKENHTFKQV